MVLTAIHPREHLADELTDNNVISITLPRAAQVVGREVRFSFI